MEHSTLSPVETGHGRVAERGYWLLTDPRYLLLKREQTAKCGVKSKRPKAGWDEDHLLRVLLG